MEPLAAPPPPPPPLSFADWRGVGAVTIIAVPILHTLVQVHDQPKGFFDCESFMWYFLCGTCLSGSHRERLLQ